MARGPLAYWAGLWLVVSLKCAVVYLIAGLICAVFLRRRPSGRAMAWLLVVWSFIWLTALEWGGHKPVPATEVISRLPDTALMIVGHAYALIVLFLLGLVVHSAIRLRLLRSYAAPLDIHLAVPGQTLSPRSGLRIAEQVAIYSCGQVTTPTSFGVLRPVIVIPVSPPGTIYRQFARAAVVHEFIAVLRFDALWTLLARLVQCLYFIHPAAWLAYRHYCLAREQVCDSWTVRTTGDAAGYEACLLGLTGPSLRISTCMGLDTPMSRGDQLIARWRVEALRHGERPRSLSLRLAAVGIVAWMLMLAGMAGVDWQSGAPGAGLSWHPRPMLMGVSAAAVAATGLAAVIILERGRRPRLEPPVDGSAGRSRQTISECIQWLTREWEDAHQVLSLTARRLEPLLLVVVLLAATLILCRIAGPSNDGEHEGGSAMPEVRR